MDDWKVVCPSFTMGLNESGNGIELITQTTRDACKFSGDEVLRLRNALDWAIEKIEEINGDTP